MMRKLFTTFLIGCILLTMGGLMTAETAAKDSGKSCLWEVKTKTGKCYLLGSIHLYKQEYYPLNKAIEDAFEQTDVLAVEFNILNMGAALKLVQNSLYKDDQTLQGNLSKEGFKKLTEELKKMKMDVSMFQKQKPWFLAMNTLNFKAMSMGVKAEYGIDVHFLKKAMKMKKEIVELESVDSQLAVLESMNKEEAEAFLMSVFRDEEKQKTYYDDLLNYWRTGNIKEMKKLVADQMEETPELKEFNKRFVNDRDDEMVKHMLPLLESGKKCLIMVGCFHMIGDNGIVAQLKKKGYRVTQL